jgi:hypothetical protein
LAFDLLRLPPVACISVGSIGVLVERVRGPLGDFLPLPHPIVLLIVEHLPPHVAQHLLVRGTALCDARGDLLNTREGEWGRGGGGKEKKKKGKEKKRMFFSSETLFKAT